MQYCESYLEKYYDNFKFFEMECEDKRIRETNMRIKRCLKCPGKINCRMNPTFWLEGEEDRKAENDRMLAVENK